MTNQKTETSKPRDRHLQLRCAVALVVVGCVLLASAFLMPPPGQIHDSVLIAFGEILTFVGALFGIDYRYRSRDNS